MYPAARRYKCNICKCHFKSVGEKGQFKIVATTWSLFVGKCTSFFTLKGITDGARVQISKYNALLGKNRNVLESESGWDLS